MSPVGPKGTYKDWSNNTHNDWWKDPGLRKNVGWCVVLYCGLFQLGFAFNLINVLQTLPRWREYFGNPTGNHLGAILAASAFPVIIIAPIISMLTDYLGRIRTIVLGSSILAVGSLLGAFSQNEPMFVVGRVLTGASAELMYVPCICLIAELAHPRIRGIVTTFNGCIYYVGTSLSAWIAFGTLHWDSNWSWRLPVLLQIMFPTTLLLASIRCPESPRWLISQGRNEEALNVLAELHANGDKDDELVRNELLEITSYVERDKEAKQTSWSSLFATPGNRKRLAVIMIIAAGTMLNGSVSIGSYMTPMLGLVGVTDPQQISIVNGVMAVWSFFTSATAALYVNKFGRRPLWITSTVLVTIFVIIITALAAVYDAGINTSKELGYAFVAMLFLQHGSSAMAWNLLMHSYTAEILPFSIRAKALAFFEFTQYVLLSLQLFVNPIALENARWKYFLLSVCVNVILIFLVLKLFIETKGRTMEQVAALFDKPNPVKAADSESGASGSSTPPNEYEEEDVKRRSF
ncbi:hypothetical protein D9758_002531 [Tetrapyrgos nigripes]|uniref:Major facilitator superfamily (MFS) profile domain-containing protein n=1 Tax=Tetrapyrgos nigripes TaxID=182062 RepID=A0A8H5GR47_9AGAR|nr:hypothetical protein D9758_002531 [Tetrapyrgos nigripes]